MVKVNTRSGRTLTYDLATEAGSVEWARVQADPAFQLEVTGLGILHEGAMHVLPATKAFQRTAYTAELLRNGDKLVGERVTLQADDMQATITVYFGQSPRLVRFDLRRVGRPRFVSRGRPWPQGTP